MKVLNIHRRVIDIPIVDLESSLRTLSSKHDLIWPTESWPRMKFKEGIKIGAHGGHVSKPPK